MQHVETDPKPGSWRFSGFLALALIASTGLAMGPCRDDGSRSGAALFLSPQSHPLAIAEDGTLLYVANTTSGTVSLVDISSPESPSEVAEIPVGLDPVSVAILPGGVGDDELVFVTNHISDSISVISRNRLGVVQTIQDLDGNGVTTTDEPVGITFASSSRAFVALDQPNQILVLDIDESGAVRLHPERLSITAQAPRAVAAVNGRLYVAAFESGNQTEFPSCAPGDDRPLVENDDALTDEGCEFTAEILTDFDAGLGGTVLEFAAQNPNIGGSVIRDTDIPDRDLFVFDAESLDLEEVVEGVGTLLSSVAVGSAGRVYVPNTEARNHLDGLAALDNRLFENRLSYLDCNPGCGSVTHVDLDAAALATGQTVPTPYGIAVSEDGETLVLTAAAADGDPEDGRQPMHGLFTLDRNGNVLGSALVGALPEGVALQSDANGAARTAYVLNTADSTLSVVDVADPTDPRTLVAALRVGSDPTPSQVRQGRIAFGTARASTNHTFACASCHPNGNIDQILWTINTVQGPADGPNEVGELAEPRTTMPIRGLRDTLPLHWEGTLADPIPGVNEFSVFDSAPDCNIEADGEIGCIRHLVDAALSGPMCQHNQTGGCGPGPGQTGPDGSGLAGALTNTERDAMAAFQAAVSYPPSPERRPSDTLSELANDGVADFFTNEDGLGINDGIGQVVDFAPTTCADNPMGCHSLPLTVSTNSSVVGGFDAPSARGMWDRSVLFSNGIFSSEEVLRMAQACADGTEPPPKTIDILGVEVEVTGDPCNLHSPVIEQFVAPLAELPFPSGEEIYRPELGLTERGAFIATFEGLFALVYGVRGDRIWQYQVEISVGLPGLTGRQLSVTAANAFEPATAQAMAQIEEAATIGKIRAVARFTAGADRSGSVEEALGRSVRELRFARGSGRWTVPGGSVGWSGDVLRRQVAAHDLVMTITAELPGNISIGGRDRQPLLDIDPDARVGEQDGEPPSLARPPELTPSTFRLGAWYVEPGATVLVNGSVCHTCFFDFHVAQTGDPVIDLRLDPGLPAGVHVLQVLNPEGWASNEMPICVTNGDDICVN